LLTDISGQTFGPTLTLDDWKQVAPKVDTLPTRKSQEVRRPQQNRGVGLASRNQVSGNYVVQLLQEYINVTSVEVAALFLFMFVQRPRLGCLNCELKRVSAT